MTTVLVTACGAPGAARMLRALKENGERDGRLVGVDMSDRAIAVANADGLWHPVFSAVDGGQFARDTAAP